MKNLYSSDFELNFYFNPKTIANQDLVFEIYEFFETGIGKDFFNVKDFFNILWWHQKFLSENLDTPFDVVEHLKKLPFDKLQVQILMGYILKWYGGYPVHNFNPQYNTVLKLIEREYINYHNTIKSTFGENALNNLKEDSNGYKGIRRGDSNPELKKEFFFLESLDSQIKNENIKVQDVKKDLVKPDTDKIDEKPTEQLIFVSHSSKDTGLIKSFIDKILKLTLKVDSDQIFCTSLEESSIKSGEDFRDAIKGSLQKATLVLLIITENYRTSEVCLNEMGAAWVLNNKIVSFIVPPVDYKSVGFIQEPNQLLKLNKKEDILKFIDEEKKESNKIKIGEINRHIEDFLDAVKDSVNSVVQKPVQKTIKPLNQLGLIENDIIEIKSREGLYLYQTNKLRYIADDSAFSLHAYGYNRKDRKSIDYADAINLIDVDNPIPVLHSCKIMIDTLTNKKWLLVRDERRFLPDSVYTILVKKEGYKIVHLSHQEVMRYPEGDKLIDTTNHFA
jgi:hypothetical protein